MPKASICQRTSAHSHSFFNPSVLPCIASFRPSHFFFLLNIIKQLHFFLHLSSSLSLCLFFIIHRPFFTGPNSHSSPPPLSTSTGRKFTFGMDSIVYFRSYFQASVPSPLPPFTLNLVLLEFKYSMYCFSPIACQQ